MCNLKLCFNPDRCQALKEHNEQLAIELINCRYKLGQFDSEPAPVPDISLPSRLVTTTAPQIESMIRELGDGIEIYIDDTKYKLPPINDVKLFIWHMAVYDGLWMENEYDCDDFTLVLNAKFAQHLGWRWTPRFDCWYHESFGAHSALLLGALDEAGEPKLYLIEGQESDMSVAVRDAVEYLKDKEPWLVK